MSRDKYQIEEKKLLQRRWMTGRHYLKMKGRKLRNRCLAYIQEATLDALFRKKIRCVMDWGLICTRSGCIARVKSPNIGQT
jgi:hypothetical protein